MYDHHEHGEHSPALCQLPGNSFKLTPGDLDGLAIMRYAHVSRAKKSGGVEQYLRHVNRGLLERHRMTIVQMHLVIEQQAQRIETEHVGKGCLIWVPVQYRPINRTLGKIGRRFSYMLDRKLHSPITQNNIDVGDAASVYRCFFSHRGGHLLGRSLIFSDYLTDLLTEYDVDILAMHWCSYDTERLAIRAKQTGVPVVLINHFENARLADPIARRVIKRAVGIGTLSSHDVPAEVSSRCVTLGDGIDTEFFNVRCCNPGLESKEKLILMPARIVEGKGHDDLIEALTILLQQRSKCRVVFAGIVDSEALFNRLQTRVSAMGLANSVSFCGEVNQEVLRDWYKVCDLVVLPSYSEGLGRVLLEAQAMGKPVVAYDCGGVPDALLPEVTGFLVPLGSVSELAEKIGWLLQNPEAREAMGKRGRAFVVSRYGLPSLINRHEALYSRVLTARS